MSSKSRKRRQRKSKQRRKNDKKHNANYSYKFETIEQAKLNDTLLSGYIREIKQHIHADIIPFEIEKLCNAYFTNNIIALKKIDNIIPKITKIDYETEPWYPYSDYYPYDRYSLNYFASKYPEEIKLWIAYQNRKKLGKLKINTYNLTPCILKFNFIFNELNSYQKRLVCNRIIRDKKIPIHDLRVWPVKTGSNAIFEQLYFVQYILYKRYNTISKLDLSELDLNDNHILCLFNAIENMLRYNEHKKQQKIDRKNEEMHKNTKQTTIYSQDPIIQKEVEKQFKRMRELQKQKIYKVEIKMKLDTLNLSLNNITDKYLPFLLRIIKKYMPKLKLLDLSSNNITNKSLPVIIKYGIKTLRIDLSNSKGITMKGLNKYKRTDYDDEIPEIYVYCENMVYFVNEMEQQQYASDACIRQKGKTFKEKMRYKTKRRNRIFYDGCYHQECMISMADYWSCR